MHLLKIDMYVPSTVVVKVVPFAIVIEVPLALFTKMSIVAVGDFR
jgi:hypothetical protein